VAICEAMENAEVSLDELAASFKVIQFTCIGTRATVCLMLGGRESCFCVSASLCCFKIAARELCFHQFREALHLQQNLQA